MAMARLAAALACLTACDQVFGVAAPIDGTTGVDDGTVDSSNKSSIDVTNVASLHSYDVAVLGYQATVPASADRALLVSVHLGSACAPPTPEVSSILYGTASLSRIATVLGTPCSLEATRSEHWLLVDPPVGTAQVLVRLAGPAPTFHSNAISFAGVDAVTPVRGSATASNSGTSSSITAPSAAGDLVVNTVGHGGGIVAPGGGATTTFISNVDDRSTLNNTAASTSPAEDASTTATWTFSTADEWQSISTSLRPAP